MYFKNLSLFTSNFFVTLFFAHSVISPLSATDLQDEESPASLVVSRSLPINIFDKALAVTKSRLSFYKLRQALLEGKDEVSLAYQKEITTENNVHVTSGMGPELIMQMMFSPGKYEELALTSNKKGNTEFLNQWRYVKNAILKLKQKWDVPAFQEFQRMRVFFAMRENANKVPEEGFNVHKDINYIASDINDIDAIQELLMQTDSYLRHQQALKAAEEKAKQEKQRKEFATELWANKSPDEIAAWIEGDEKKSTKRQKGNRQQKGKNSTLLPKSASVEKKTAPVTTEPSVDSTKLTKSAHLIEESNKSPIEEKKTEVLPNAVVQPKKVIDRVDITPKAEVPKVITTSQPTKQKNITNSNNAKVEDQNIIPQVTQSPALILDEDHITTLKSVLRASSHPPVWGKAVKAVCEIIKQWGGSYREDHGKGSAAEFWIGNTRFIVDKTHSNGLMYRAQMKFMAKGLQRAGVSLELLDSL